MRLKITSAGKTWEYAPPAHKSSLTIGSREDNDIVLAGDAKASSMHLRIDRFLEDWTFTDQMSDSGTLLNGAVEYTGSLKAGDELRLGDSRIVVVNLEQAQAAPRHVNDAVPMPHAAPSAPISSLPRRDSYGPRSEVKDKSWQTVIKPSRKKESSKYPAIIFVLVFVLFIVVYMVWRTVEQDAALPAQAAQTPAAKTGPAATRPADAGTDNPASKPDEQEYRHRINQLERDKNRPPYERLLDLDALVKEITELKLTSLFSHIERASTNISLELSREMQRRYSDDNIAVYQLKEKNDYRSAQARLQGLAAYCKLSKYHEYWAERHEIDRYIERETPNIERLNLSWIGTQMSTADEALTRLDYGSAADTIEGLVKLAVLDEAVGNALLAEAARYRGYAAEQEQGRREPARKPFDPRKDRLPPAPKSPFLPSGEYSSQRQESLVRNRLTGLAGDKDFTGLAAQHCGHSATLTGYSGGRLYLKVTRPLEGGVDWHYTLSVAPHLLLPATRVRLYENLPELTQNVLVATLMLCFDNGLLDDAARVACSLWRLAPEHKEHIDILLATKLGIEVPEGGFIERDGTLVVPE